MTTKSRFPVGTKACPVFRTDSGMLEFQNGGAPYANSYLDGALSVTLSGELQGWGNYTHLYMIDYGMDAKSLIATTAEYQSQ